MKHPALVRKLKNYRYEKLYSRYTWIIVGLSSLVAANLLSLVYCVAGGAIGLPVMVVFACAAFLVCLAIGDHFGARLAKRKLEHSDAYCDSGSQARE